MSSAGHHPLFPPLSVASVVVLLLCQLVCVVWSLHWHSEPDVLKRHGVSARVSPHTLLHGLVWVVPLQVFHHLELLSGLVGAVETVVGLLVGVGQVVVLQPRSPAEGLGAHLANKGPLLAVLLLVGLEQEACLEGLAALLADEGAHVTMACVPVYPQGVGPIGAILTFLTCIWFGS